MNTRIALHHRLVVATIAVASIATVGLLAQVATPTETTAGTTPVSQSDGSFDRAEYRRHLSLIEQRAHGFELAEQSRFGRLALNPPVVAAPTGFDLAEAQRHQGLASD